MLTARITQGLAALATVALLAGTPVLADGGDPAGRLERGRQALAPFQAGLQAALQEGLAKGPLEAIDTCRVQAPAIARAASTNAGPDVEAVEVGRTSHRLRNPSNAPRDWVRPLLDGYLAEPGNRAPRAVDLGSGRWGYVQPILVQPQCLTCHGSAIAGPLSARIAVLYPKDRAVGFRDGDFRGLFWAEIAPAR